MFCNTPWPSIWWRCPCPSTPWPTSLPPSWPVLLSTSACCSSSPGPASPRCGPPLSSTTPPTGPRISSPSSPASLPSSSGGARPSWGLSTPSTPAGSSWRSPTWPSLTASWLAGSPGWSWPSYKFISTFDQDSRFDFSGWSLIHYDDTSWWSCYSMYCTFIVKDLLKYKITFFSNSSNFGEWNSFFDLWHLPARYLR